MNRPPRNWRASPSLTLTEAAAVLGLSRSRAYELAHSGDLPTHRDHLGRQRVKPRDLEPLLAHDQPDLFTRVDRPKQAENPEGAITVPHTAQQPLQVATLPTGVYQAARAALKHENREPFPAAQSPETEARSDLLGDS